MEQDGDTIAAFRDPAPFTADAAGLALAFYPGGRARLERLLQMIGDSRRSLKMVFYIYEPDASGQAVRDALVAAAQRGVAVTLILDGFGATAGEEFFAPLVAAGGTYRCFQARWTRRYLIRNHQKLVIADSRIAMLGGFNIADAYFAPPSVNGWNDLALTIEGPVVARVEDWFAQIEAWTTLRKGQFRAIRQSVREWDSGKGAVRLLIGGPTKGLSSWARVVGEDLINGQRLDMIMAYFAPPRRLLRRMQRIAQKGDTRLVLPGLSDNAATIGASRLLYRGLLKSAAKIWEFQPCKLHTKLIVLDNAVYLGSANFDMRSLYLNLEIVLRIEDRALADRMRDYMSHHIIASRAITPEVHRQQAGLFNRMRWAASWLLVAVIDYSVSRKLNLGL